MARIDDFLIRMTELGGSDLHLCATLPPKCRIHGSLQALAGEAAIPPDQMTAIMREICPPEKWDWFQSNLDCDFAYEVPGLARFRVNYFFNHFGPGTIMRVIPTEIKTIEQLRLPPILRDIARQEHGLILVTGPTGSGKSTTLAAMLDDINATRARHIITIEDPIEFVHPNRKSVIVQREIGDDAPSFAAALQGAMRADPDIILVGEMRDQETIQLALTCATMGILVFATLHTNNAPKTIDRIIDSFPALQQPQIRAMLAQTLTAIVSQLLCKTADGNGRVACHEILLRTDALPAAIRDGAVSTIRSIIEQSAGLGMQTMDSCLRQLVQNKTITPLEAYMKASSKADFERMLTPADLKALRG